MATRLFHLGDVLSITAGKLLSNRHMDGIYDILNFMTGDYLYKGQLPRAMNECRPYLLQQHPRLANVVIEGITPENFHQKMEALCAEHGQELPVESLPANAFAKCSRQFETGTPSLVDDRKDQDEGPELQLQALTLHERGHTYSNVGRILGVSRSRAIQLAHCALRARENMPCWHEGLAKSIRFALESLGYADKDAVKAALLSGEIRILSKKPFKTSIPLVGPLRWSELLHWAGVTAQELPVFHKPTLVLARERLSAGQPLMDIAQVIARSSAHVPGIMRALLFFASLNETERRKLELLLDKTDVQAYEAETDE